MAVNPAATLESKKTKIRLDMLKRLQEQYGLKKIRRVEFSGDDTLKSIEFWE